MAIDAGKLDGRGGSRWRIGLWGLAGFILLVPLVAMRLTNEVNWTGSDFLFAGMLIGGVGALFELAVHKTPNVAYGAAIAFALAAAFLIIWANGAVGMIGSEDNPFNLLFLGVIVLALAGVTAARFRPAGMAATMLAAGIVHACVSIAGMSQDIRGGIFSAAFAGLWLLSAALFRKAARD